MVLWFWLLPCGVLFSLNLRAFSIVGGGFSPEQRQSAYLLGIAGILNACLSLLAFFLLRRQLRRHQLSSHRLALWGAGLIGLQVSYLAYATTVISVLLPTHASSWIYPAERAHFHQYSFGLIPLFLGLIWVAAASIGPASKKPPIAGLAWVAAFPVLLYLLGTLLRPGQSWIHVPALVFIIMVVGLSLVVFAGLIRLLIVSAHAAKARGLRYEMIATVVIAWLLPIAGLLLNMQIPFPADFQSWEVYALTIANGAFLIFSLWQGSARPTLCLALLGASFPFSLYFFVVFLPYTPLSLLAMIAVGAGFLILTPCCLFALHLYLLVRAFHRVAAHFTFSGSLTVTLATILILPGAVWMRAFADRAALHHALDYAYTPAIKPGGEAIRFSGNLGNLRRALESHEAHREGLYSPLISDFYSWAVFDHMILSRTRQDHLSGLFFGSEGHSPGPQRLHGFSSWGVARGATVRERSLQTRARPTSKSVTVDQLRLTPSARGIRNQATLQLTLRHTQPDLADDAEYVAALPLPPGIFVNGFRLHINGTPVPGRITEKKTALWIYSTIRDVERRDPAVLSYTADNQLELRVFPIQPHVPTTVEIDFLLPYSVDAVDLTPAPSTPKEAIQMLGRLTSPYLARTENGGLFAGQAIASSLPPVKRERYLHLILDRSKDNAFEGDLRAALQVLRTRFPDLGTVRISLANYEVTSLVSTRLPWEQLPSFTEKDLDAQLPRSGGLALDLALAHALQQHVDLDLDAHPSHQPPPPHPVWVVLGRTAQTSPPDWSRSKSWDDLSGPLEILAIGQDGTESTHTSPALRPRENSPLLQWGHSLRPLATNSPVHFAPGPANSTVYFWSPEDQNWKPLQGVLRPESSDEWIRASDLLLRQRRHDRSPGSQPSERIDLIREARQLGILTPATTYIVVENPAQWRMLELSERQSLGQNSALDFVETPAPPAALLALVVVAYLVWRRRKTTAPQPTECSMTVVP